jgi:hypothetical protein
VELSGMRQRLDPSRLGPASFAALFGVLYALTAVPVIAGSVLPLVDYPNHLARMAVLAKLPHDPTLQAFYALAWRPIPDLAMDVLVPPLLRVMPLFIAGKVFVLATFLLLAGGTAAVHRVLFARWSAWPCLAFLVIYGRLLLWGFLNDLFGLGLALCALAAMIALGGRFWPLRLGVGIVAALALYVAHFMAFGVYAVLWLGHEAAPLLRARQRADWARLAIAMLPLLLAPALLVATGTGAGGSVEFGRPWRKFDLLFNVFDVYDRPFDIACFALAAAALGCAYWRRWLRLAPVMALPLALLAVAYLVMPATLMGATGVDRRLPLALVLVLFGASEWAVEWPRLERGLLAAAALMFVVRLAVVAVSWQASDREYRAVLAGLDMVAPGGRVAVAFPAAAINVTPTPLVHFPTLAAARRDAFVPTLFAEPTQQPLVMQPAYRALAARTSPDNLWAHYVAATAPLDTATRAALGDYDYVAFVGVAPFVLGDEGGLSPVFRAPRFRLYRVTPEARAR